MRRRVAIVSGLAVAIAVLLASLTAYVLVRDAMYSEVDRTLRERADQPGDVRFVAPLPGVRVQQGLSEWFAQALPSRVSVPSAPPAPSAAWRSSARRRRAAPR